MNKTKGRPAAEPGRYKIFAEAFIFQFDKNPRQKSRELHFVTHCYRPESLHGLSYQLT
jgi:hypothetical protein